MSLFVIADLHLPGAEGERKSMSCFGRRWIGAEEKLIKNWNAIITEADSVVIPGDISWAMTLEEANEKFVQDKDYFINLYYLSGTENLWNFDENGLWNGYEVKEYNGYGDFCILLRSVKNCAKPFMDEIGVLNSCE